MSKETPLLIYLYVTDEEIEENKIDKEELISDISEFFDVLAEKYKLTLDGYHAIGFFDSDIIEEMQESREGGPTDDDTIH